MRIGHGYDVHKLVKTSGAKKDLIIGGVKISHEKVLEGHSDADVLIHAIVDALLGAAGLDDIGTYFPPSDDQYKGKDSLFFLEESKKMLKEQGYEVGNIDCTILAEAPKMRPHIPEMKKTLSQALEIKVDQINIKATTTEKLGFIGREEGIAAEVVCLIS